MLNSEPNYFYYHLFHDERQSVQRTFDMRLSAGFCAETRWGNGDKYYVLYGLASAEIHLELINSKVDLREGDKLGGSLDLRAQIKTTTSEADESSGSSTAGIGGEAGVSGGKINANVGVQSGHKKVNNLATETSLGRNLISGFLANEKKPFWKFKALSGLLDGKLVPSPLCIVKLETEHPLKYNSKSVVKPYDIEITKIPRTGWSWYLFLKELPYKGLAFQRIKKEISIELSVEKNYVDMEVA